MKPEKIISVIEMYEEWLQDAGVPKIQIDKHQTFQSVQKHELLAHAHFLCEGVKKYAQDPNRQRKTGSHLAAVQMCLSFAGWYTLGELKSHNKP